MIRPNGIDRPFEITAGHFQFPRGVAFFRVSSILLFFSIFLVTPWFFGGVLASFQDWILRVLLAVAVLQVIGLGYREFSQLRLPSLIVPLWLAIGLGAFQVMRLPTEAVQLMTPSGVDMQKRLIESPQVSSDPATFSEEVTPTRISLHPAATKKQIVLLAIGLAVFNFACVLVRSRQMMILGTAALGLNGALLSLFGIAQNLSWNGKLFWTIELAQGGRPFASFVNRNNAAGFLCLCFGASLTFMFWSFFRKRDVQPGEAVPRMMLGTPTLSMKILQFIAELDGLKLFACSMAVLNAAGILLSQSRGGVIAAGIAFLVCALMGVGSRSHRVFFGSLAAVCIVAVIGLAAYVGAMTSIEERLSTIVDAQTIKSETRFSIWRDSMSAGSRFLRIGSGLGTYQHVYRPFETSYRNATFVHAENQYVETFVEAGLPGLALLLATIVVSLGVMYRLYSSDRSDGRALAIGGMFAVVSQLTHGLFDFGMFLPANFMALAFLVGACAGRLSRIQNIRSTHWYTLPEHRWIPSLQATMVLLAVAWSWSEIRSASLVDQDVARCRALKNTDVENFVATERAIRKLEESIGRRDDDAEAWNELAAAHLRRYRQQLTNSPELGLAGSFQERFNQTELGTLNYAVMNLLRMKKTDELNRIRLHPATVESLSRARDCWRRAVRGCPLLLVPHLRLTESAAILTGTETPAEHGKALLLAPKNPAVLYWAGMLEFNAGRTEQSCVIWQKSIDQSSERTNDVFSLLTRRMSYSTIFDAVEPNGGGFLVSLAERVFDLEKPSPERELLIPKFRLMLAKKLFPPGDESYFEGMIAAHQSDRTKAIEALQTAVLSAPERVARRYSLALTLIAEHRETEAIAELEAAQKYEPMNQTIRGTLNRLKGKPKTTAER